MKIGFIGLIGLIGPLAAFAALPPSPDAIAISLLPENPGPNELVDARASLLSGGSIADYDIEWRVNGVVVAEGRGEARASFRTGNAGAATEVSVTLFENGERISKTLTIRPASVVLVVEADTTAPPFYRGKALFSYQGSARIVAVPFFANAGVRLNPKELVYTWRILDRVPEGSSGVGRDTFVHTARAPFRPTEIEVEVATPGGTSVARASVVAGAVPPSALLYEEHPLYGLLSNRALASVALATQEMRLAARPLFFNKSDVPLLEYRWTQNSEPLSAAVGEHMSFRSEGASGRARIGVEIQNPRAMFQAASTRALLEF